MGTFNTGEELHGKHLNVPTKDKPWMLTEAVSWTSNDGVTINVPIGFRTDLFSIHPILTWMRGLDPSGVGVLAAVVHDYLCKTKGKQDGKKAYIDSVRAAKYLREGMLRSGQLSVNIWVFVLAGRGFNYERV